MSCGYCSQVCPKGLVEDKPPFEITDRDKCDLCGICVKECCTGAKDVIGDDHTSEELFQEIMKDKSFYDSSGGGVTFSGGEPMMQPAFLAEAADACRAAGIRTAIETSMLRFDAEILRRMDWIMADLKIWDSDTHRQYTGVPNEVIKENLRFKLF